MGLAELLGLLGGLALFLYGMHMMSSGLEAAAGNRMKQILERLTSNRFLGVAVGAGITAVVQSSSATTVMVVGFVNSGMMTLRQAVWIIMGANIGTTITGQLIALDIGELAPLIAFAGVVSVLFIKRSRFHNIGQIIAGLGILFIGMEMMSGSMSPLRESEAFIGLLTKFSNPLFGILAGMLFTAIIQSSSASVGILQALAASGLIGLPSAVFVLFGQNIGTCITAVLASIGTGRSAKRATIIHLMFNLIGTAVFSVLATTTPITNLVAGLTPGDATAQIANMHSFFNIATTLMLLPFGTMLAALAIKILPERETEQAEKLQLIYIRQAESSADSQHQIGASAIIVNAVWRELERMSHMVHESVGESFQAVLDGSPDRLERVLQLEDYVDYLNKEISAYISRTMIYEHNEKDSRLLSSFFRIAGNLERIGDHAVNICEYTKYFKEKAIEFSEPALKEIDQMRIVSERAVELIGHMDAISLDQFAEISALEQKIDDMTISYRTNQIRRMQACQCGEESSVLYSEMLTDFERIGDHVLNVGKELTQIGIRASNQAL